MNRPMILASGSPRRQELIKKICDEYTVITADIDESSVPGEKPGELVYRLSYLKAKKVFEETSHLGARIVIGADTVVALEDQILGKPADRADASRMLHELSGSHHQVYTGVAILWDEGGEMRSARFTETTQVDFWELTEEEIEQYIDSHEPDDKAGAYAIQMQGGLFVKGISGDYSNVLGFPISRIYHTMKDAGLLGGFPVK